MDRSRSLPWLAAGALVLTACGPRVEPADLVLQNGHLVTLDDARPEAQALAARGGRIVRLGSDEEIAPYVGPDTRVIDLEGHLAVPGLIEGHGHFMGLGDSKIQLDLRPAKSWDEIVAQVAAAVAEAPPGAWIRGRGWHQSKWTTVPEPNVEGFPLHDSLSAVSPANPVLLTHASGHAVFVNARALELAGIDASTPDPPGGEILRDAAGRATGLLRENAEELVQEVRTEGGLAPRPELERMARLASEEALSKGITTFTDAGSSFATIDFLKDAADRGLFGVRLWVMVADTNEALAEKLDAYRLRDYAGGMLSVGGIKLWLDGALGSRGAWLLEPYTDSPGSTGLNLISLESARETAELAIDHGYQLCIHAIGDRANREVLDLYERVFADHPEAHGLRWRIEHAQHLDPADVPRFAQLGVIASMQGVHCTSDGSWVPDRLGDARAAAGAYVWRDLIDAGALIVNGTDTPVEDVDPIASYYASVTRRLADGTTFYPEQRMTRREALESYTKNGAYGIFQEGEKGTLTEGKLADVTVLSRDILTVPDDEIPGTRVLYTIVGGAVAYAAP